MTAQELYEIVRKEIDVRASSDPLYRGIQKKIDDKNADFSDTARLSGLLSEILGDKLAKHILELPPNEGRSEVCQQLLRDHFNETGQKFEQVQSQLDRTKGIDLGTVTPEFPAERVKQVSDSLDDTTVPDATIQRRCRGAVSNVANSMHDSFIRKNAEVRADLGLKPIIQRFGAGCCKWCAEISGKWRFGEQPDDVFRRHDNCTCIIVYDTQVLRGKKDENGKYTRTWEGVDPKEVERNGFTPATFTPEQAQRAEQNQLGQITRLTPEQARNLSLTTGGNDGRINTNGEETIRNIFSQFDKRSKDSSPIVDGIIENHECLSSFTPESMKKMLEDLGYEVKPLGGKSSLKGIPFEEGGGYRTAFGGDGYFQYHPKKNSHHDGEYWKVGNGERKMHRYEMDGTPKIK